MTAIGETLRCERIRRNLELQQIAEELKISARFLSAIEREAFDELPGAIFVRSFVRQYARLLGLDEDELAAEAQRIVEPVVDEPPTLAHSVSRVNNLRMAPMRAWGSVGDGGGFRWSSALQALGLVVAVTLVCSGVYAWWQRERRSAAAPPAQTAAVKRPAPPAAAAPVPVTPAPSDAGAVPPPAAPSGSASEARPAPAGSAERQASDRPAAETAPATQPSAVQPGAGGPVHVQVTALEASWVRARSDGKYAFSATLDPNQTRTVDAGESVELLLGNAGGVSILLNGKPVGPLGPKGQVRTVQLNSGGFKIVSAKAPEPAPADPL